MYGPLSVHVPDCIRAFHARVYTVCAILFLYLHRSTYRDSLCIKNAHILVYFFFLNWRLLKDGSQSSFFLEISTEFSTRGALQTEDSQ